MLYPLQALLNEYRSVMLAERQRRARALYLRAAAVLCIGTAAALYFLR